jgi:WD40 repeat protein
MKTGKLLNSIEEDKDNKYMVLVLSPDGKTVAGAGFNGVVYQYDTKEFNHKGATIKGPGASPDAMLAESIYLFMKYSPDGKYLALATLRTEIYIYDTKTGGLVRKIKPLDPDYDHRIFPEHLVFSGDGKMTAIEYQNGKTMITKTTSNQPGKFIEGSSPSLSTDGNKLALKTGKGIELFQTSTGKSLAALAGTETALGNSIFSPNGQSLAVVMPGKTTFWDVKELTVTQTIETSFSDYQAIAISQDGEAFAASTNQLIELYQTKSGDRRTLESQHPIQFLGFSANDSVLVSAGSTWLSVWDLKQSKMIKEIELSGNIQNMDISNDGKMAIVVMVDNVTVLYNLSNGDGKNVSESSQKIASATFVDNANILALDSDQKVYVSTSQNRALTNIKEFKDVSTLIASNDNSTVTFITNADGILAITIYDIAKQEILKSPLKDESIFAVSPVNHIVAIPNTVDGYLTLMDIDHSDKSCQIKDFGIAAKQMIFSPDGQQLFINGINGIIYIFGIGVHNKNS